ncbi:MAG TPA: DUF6220 domain-containing protein [Candidatus Eisenbacteria bacterium]|nr:DUF6220 domain-containing protein [Candidatus Eisenbacteria bacterium]
MRSIARRLYLVAAWLFVASIVFQVFLAGAAISNLGGSGNFSTHAEFGYTVVGLIALAVLLTAVLSGLPRREIGIAFGLLVLYIVQTILPSFRDSTSWIAALHLVNALVLFAAAIWVAWRARRWLGEWNSPTAPPAST